ncbi:MAG TPA: GNAT family N-acetyltransferase [Candidatus Elarobacter sp.]
MYLDQLPDLSRARLIRASARGTAIRDGDRAVAVAFVADGSLLAGDTLVRFDVARGEAPARRLSDAFAATGARNVWFYGGDEVLRRAAVELDLQLRVAGGAFVRRAPAADVEAVVFRPPAQRDRMTLPELLRDHAPGFGAPVVEVGTIDGEPAGIVAAEVLDATWTELRVFVQPALRGRKYGAALMAAAADGIEATGRRVCAGIEGLAGRERAMLEAAGFRLADYYFLGTKR